MRRKILYLFFIICVSLFSLAGCSENKSINEANTNANTVSANRINAQIAINNTSNNSNAISNTSNTVNEIRIAEHEIAEEEIAAFSTKLNGADSPRTRNIKITSSKLNGTTVNNGETFSFCKTIGKSTAAEGYEKADTFDSDGNTIQEYGGGNCQVSSTLYNAVLKVSDLEVKERHAHSKEVHYVAKNKDAAVAHGSVDFKFKNNTGSTIKIYANSDLKSVNIRIVKVK